MSSFRRDQYESDESTPIRAADDQAARRYDTSNSNSHFTTPTDSSAGATSQPSSSTLVNPNDNAGRADGGAEDSKKQQHAAGWLGRISEKYGSVTLENKGAVARDHLALERTFLAWLRTSLAFASIGIAVTQLFRLNTTLQNRSEAVRMAARSLPLSPLVGQSVPAEMLPFLQQMAASMASPTPPPTLGPTLLDQILLLPPSGLLSRETEDLVDPSLKTDNGTAMKLRHIGKPLGATFIGISIVILFIGFHRYFEAQHWIIRGKFPASRGSIFAVTIMTGSLIVASLVVVLAVAAAPLHKS
jgi:uncharacterized membrane protein YidH (DUF202 family)